MLKYQEAIINANRGRLIVYILPSLRSVAAGIGAGIALRVGYIIGLDLVSKSYIVQSIVLCSLNL